jgi:hypothetical protein
MANQRASQRNSCLGEVSIKETDSTREAEKRTTLKKPKKGLIQNKLNTISLPTQPMEQRKTKSH